jgi:hypothetical protein
MKLKDFTLPTENISTPESLMSLDRNSTAAGKFVNWRHSKIGMTEGARESNPFRQIAIDSGNSAQHLRLERLMHKDGTYSASRRKILHDALDEMIARVQSGSGSDSDEGDPGDDEEDIQAADSAVHRGFQSAVRNFRDVVRQSAARIPAPARLSAGRSYVQDADSVVVSRYLHPDQTCYDAIKTVTERLYSRQKNPSCQGFWAGLVHYLEDQPPNSCVSDCNQATLAPLIRKLHENRLRAT